MLGWSELETNRDTARADAADVSGAPRAAQSGLLSGTRVATAFGWRPAQALAAGDRVLTFDHGLQPLADVTRHPVWAGGTACPQRFWPLDIARGVLGNRGPFRIMPGQAVMIESDLAESIYGDPGVMFLCPATRDLLDYALGATPAVTYDILPPADAQRLTAAMDRAGGVPSPDGGPGDA